MKPLIITLLAPFIAASAMASTSLIVETGSGLIVPSSSQTCTISEQGIVTTVTSDGQSGSRPVGFTHDVPSPAVMVHLAAEAMKAKLFPTGALTSPGSSRSTYSVKVDNNQNSIRLVASATTVLRNTRSASAEKLADFMQKNCP